MTLEGGLLKDETWLISGYENEERTLNRWEPGGSLVVQWSTGRWTIRDLCEEDLRAMEPNVAAITGLKLIGYEKRLPMWENGRGS